MSPMHLSIQFNNSTFLVRVSGSKFKHQEPLHVWKAENPPNPKNKVRSLGPVGDLRAGALDMVIFFIGKVSKRGVVLLRFF